MSFEIITMNYTTILSTAEDLALSYVMLSQQDWIDKIVRERCKIVIDEIVKICVAQCLAEGIQIPRSKEVMVELAFTRGWVKSLADQLTVPSPMQPPPSEQYINRLQGS
jgi:hypothetical protein